MPPTIIQRGPKRNDSLWSSSPKSDEEIHHVSSRLDVLGALANSAELALQDKNGMGYLQFKATGSIDGSTSIEKQQEFEVARHRCSVEQKVRWNPEGCAHFPYQHSHVPPSFFTASLPHFFTPLPFNK